MNMPRPGQYQIRDIYSIETKNHGSLDNSPFMSKIENDFHLLNRGEERDLVDISKTWLEKLQENGYRLTGSRRTVVETVAGSNRALSPMEVFDLARTRYPGLGLVTVYRTLEKLEELGLIQRVHQPEGCQAFISAFNGHQHLILCSGCGKVEFFSGDNLESLFQGIGKQTGYQVRDHWLQLFGLCADCLQAET
jgi:Fur family transcriptional regulator, ferric uptake regulator